jgi:MFS family permease
MARAGELHPFGVLVLLAGAFLPIADFFVVNVALPTIDKDLHASPGSLELVVAAYGVAYAAMLVLGGRLGDRFGRHTLFQIGLMGFILSSLACGLAPTIAVLVAARLIQGLTAAAIVPQVLATVHATLEGERKVHALALYGATSGIAAVIGQLAGGLLVSADILGMSWRPIFLINVPLGVAVFFASRAVIPANRSPHPLGIDAVGTALFAATLTALLIPLTEGQSTGWPVWSWIVLATAAVLAIITITVAFQAERAGKVPLLPPSLLKLPSMWKGLSMIALFSIGFGTFMFVFALMVQTGLHQSAMVSGLTILPMAVLFFLGSVFSSKVIDRFGRAALAIGGLVQAAGLGILVTMVAVAWPHVNLVLLAVPLMMIGGGQSMLFSGLFRVVLADVPAHLGGVGGGVLITVQQSCLALGVAILGSVYLIVAPTDTPLAFGLAVGGQALIILILVIATRILPRFTTAAAARE